MLLNDVAWNSWWTLYFWSQEGLHWTQHVLISSGWTNTNAIQRANKDGKKQTKSYHFICSTPALPVLFFSVLECSVLMALVFCCKDILEKVMMQRTQQLSAFLCHQKNRNRTKGVILFLFLCTCGAKFEEHCLNISRTPVVTYLGTTVIWGSLKHS